MADPCSGAPASCGQPETHPFQPFMPALSVRFDTGSADSASGIGEEGWLATGPHDLLHHWHRMVGIGRLIRHGTGHNALRLGIDCRLSVVPMDEGLVRILHDARVRIGKVALRRGPRHPWGRLPGAPAAGARRPLPEWPACTSASKAALAAPFRQSEEEPFR
jgi:hypothetical protein